MIPIFRRLPSLDGKERLYLIGHEADIAAMCRVAGVFSEGIRWHEHNQVHFRIIKKHEERLFKSMFP